MNKYSVTSALEHQKNIISYLHPDNPYRSLITFYGVGTGKTYAAACLTYYYVKDGFKVLYLSNTLNSILNFKSEYSKFLNDLSLVDDKNKIDYLTFTSMYRHGLKYEYGLIIIDEVHNLRENANRYKNIRDNLNNAIYAKILIMTATPIIDDINEIYSIIKLSGETNPKILFKENTKKNIGIEYVEGIFKSKMKGIQLEEYENIKEDNIYANKRQATISCSEFYNPNIPLDEQSSKIARLLDTLDNEPTVIFCFYLKRGINFLTQVLDHNGYQEWQNNEISSPMQMKIKRKKYAVITGKTNEEKTKEILLNFNSVTNMDGNEINILIGSSVLNESITLFRVAKIHILSPFWNYGHVQQSIGRAIRYNSHFASNIDTVKVYLHACENSIDMKMWDITFNKKALIEDVITEQRKDEKELKVNNEFIYPIPDNILIFEIEGKVWDLTKCFDHNKYKISWCKIYEDKVICYDIKNKEKIIGRMSINKLKINKPLDNGYTIWRSCIDNRLRISYMSNTTKNKYTKRGKLLSNVNINEIEKELNCENLIEYLKKENRYFDKQIEYVV